MFDKSLSNQHGLIMESSENVTKYDVACARLLTENSVSSPEEKELIPVINNVTEKYIKKIDDSFSVLADIAVDTNQMSDFFTKIQQADELSEIPLGTPLKNVNDFGRIKPEYLTQTVKNGASIINNIINGKTTMKDLMNYFTSDLSTKIKKQLVISSKPITDIKSYLVSQENPNIVPMDSQAVMTLCVPFLRSFPVRKRELQDEIASVKNAINASTGMMKSYTETAMSLKKKGQIPTEVIDTLNYFLYNQNRLVDELISYMVFALICKIDAYTFNINSYTDLYKKVLRYNPEGSNVYHESSFEYSIAGADIDSTVNMAIYGNMSPLIDWFDRVYSSARGMYENNRNHGNEIEQLDFILDQHDDFGSPYEDFFDTMDKIEYNLKRIKISAKDPYASPEGIMQTVGLEDPLISRFSIMLSGLTNISIYSDQLNNGKSKTDVLFSILSELRKSKNYMEDIGEEIKEVHDEIMDVISFLDRNEDNEIPNELARKELIKLVTEFEEDFRNFLGIALQKMIQRGKVLEDEVDAILSQMEETIDIMDDTTPSSNFNVFAIEACMDIDDSISKILMESEMIKFRNTKLAKEYGLVMEAPAEGDTKNNDEKKDSASPTVEVGNQTKEDNQKNQEAMKEEKNTGNEQKDPEKKKSFKEKFKELIEKINSYFDKIIPDFLKGITSQITSNNEFLKKYKDVILNRSYNNITLNIYNYFNLDSNTILGDINKVSSFVSQLDANNLSQYADPNVLKEKMFGFIKLDANTTLDDGLRIYYKVGPGQTEVKKVAISNTDLKNKTADMIKFCEDFYLNNGYKEVQTAISGLKNSLDSKVKSLQNVELSEEQTTAIKNISGRVMIFTGSVLTGYRNRGQHYMFAIRKLLPKNIKIEEENTQPENGEETPAEGGNNTQQ